LKLTRQKIRVLSCYQAGYDGFWLHRLLCARGIDNRILAAASLLVDRRSRRAKTDRLDAAGLLRTLMALDRGESRVCRVVRVPSVAQEDARRRSGNAPGWSSNGVSIRTVSRAY